MKKEPQGHLQTKHRFFVNENNFDGEMIILGKGQAHQIRDVLRIKPGEHITVLNNQGWEYEVALTAVKKDKVVGQIVKKQLFPERAL